MRWKWMPFITIGIALQASAGPADVLAATARCDEHSVCTFTATVKHLDEGWDHYANAWQVLTLDGKVLATRILRHPHVGEQPFTRTLDHVAIPLSVSEVRIRARDSVHGYGGKEVHLKLSRQATQTKNSENRLKGTH